MKNRNIIANIVMIVPLISYNIYCFATKEPNTGIDFSQVFISFVLGAVFAVVGKQIRNKGKAEE